VSLSLFEWLEQDHNRLDEILAACLRGETSSYVEFRGGLLRHIAIEEKILFPAIRKAHGDSELLRQLHRDHAALSALLVPPPTVTEFEQMHRILLEHNPLEEKDGGLYAIAASLPADVVESMSVASDLVPAIPLAPHFDTDVTRRSIEILLREATETRYRAE
jgi:hypothetical protein